MKTEFIHRITKDMEGTYYTVPFSVPENTVKITVTYEYQRTTKGALADLFPSNTVDIGLMDEKGTFLGWSGSAHRSIYVGEYGSSKGYLSQKINAGEWKIIVGAYKIVANGVEVKYTVEFEEKGEQLLFGDLHIHSDASDGKYDIPTIAKMAKDIGLDFVGIANHNNYSENLCLPKIDALTFIPAVEWTHYKGHVNFFGVPAPFENSFIANSEDEMKSLISYAKNLGAVISVNHPKCPFCPYIWENEEVFDMAEIWNGPMRGTNTRGIAWWTDYLKKGRKLPAVGGSDFHKEGMVRLGNPVTAVISPSRGEKDILNAIKNGHSYIISDINGARLMMSYGKARFGDTARICREQHLHIEAKQLNGAKLVLVSDKGEMLISSGADKVIQDIRLRDEKFVYLKAFKGIGKLSLITAVSNPIYFE